ncbi:hypothetical protein JNK13_01790 [bacterium]|nr:hypothetical protein [bacterium]
MSRCVALVKEVIDCVNELKEDFAGHLEVTAHEDSHPQAHDCIVIRYGSAQYAIRNGRVGEARWRVDSAILADENGGDLRGRVTLVVDAILQAFFGTSLAGGGNPG